MGREEGGQHYEKMAPLGNLVFVGGPGNAINASGLYHNSKEVDRRRLDDPSTRNSSSMGWLRYKLQYRLARQSGC